MQDAGGVLSAYRILDSGVLQLLVNKTGTDSAWNVDREYSPALWQSVYGTRYTTDTTGMSGIEGRVANQQAEKHWD